MQFFYSEPIIQENSKVYAFANYAYLRTSVYIIRRPFQFAIKLAHILTQFCHL